MILLVIYLSLLLMAFLSGSRKCPVWTLQLGINTFKSPYFCFGIDYHPEYIPRATVSVLNIGFVIVNVVFEFYHFEELSEEEKQDVIEKLQNTVDEESLGSFIE